MLMTKYSLRKLGLRPARGEKPFAYTGDGTSLYEKEKAVPIKSKQTRIKHKPDKMSSKGLHLPKSGVL